MCSLGLRRFRESVVIKHEVEKHERSDLLVGEKYGWLTDKQRHKIGG